MRFHSQSVSNQKCKWLAQTRCDNTKSGASRIRSSALRVTQTPLERDDLFGEIWHLSENKNFTNMDRFFGKIEIGVNSRSKPDKNFYWLNLIILFSKFLSEKFIFLKDIYILRANFWFCGTCGLQTLIS